MIIGPGILHKYRAAGEIPGITFTRSAATGTYLSNAGVLGTAAANVLRNNWFDTDADGILDAPSALLEPTAQNIGLWARDLTQASWVNSNTTDALTQTGIDGTANSASLITATAGNGTILQTLASGSASRMYSAFVKRVTGTGTVNMTLDNGATWTAIVPTNSWKRFSIPTQVFTNPIIGFRLVTNTDAIAVDYSNLVSTKLLTSPIATTTIAVTRNADSLTGSFPYRPRSMTLYAKYVCEHIDSGADAVIMQVGSDTATNPRVYIAASGATGVAKIINANLAAASVAATTGSAPTNGQVVEIRGVLNSDGSVLVGQSIAGAAETVSAASGAQALEASWANTKICLGHANGAAQHAMGLMNSLVLVGVRSMDECRAIA